MIEIDKNSDEEYVRSTDEKVSVNIGKLNAGQYKVRINAYSPYAKKGDHLLAEFSV